VSEIVELVGHEQKSLTVDPRSAQSIAELAENSFFTASLLRAVACLVTKGTHQRKILP